MLLLPAATTTTMLLHAYNKTSARVVDASSNTRTPILLHAYNKTSARVVVGSSKHRFAQDAKRSDRVAPRGTSRAVARVLHQI